MKSIVVAYDQNRGIGANNDLLWARDLPADLAHFKKLTTGKSIIMGRRTFESIGSRPLPNRQNIVVSSRPTGVEGVITCESLTAAYTMSQYDSVVIGGGQLYEAALPDISCIYATEVKASFPEATIFFPSLALDEWHEVSREYHASDEKNKYDYDFVTYVRNSQQGTL